MEKKSKGKKSKKKKPYKRNVHYLADYSENPGHDCPQAIIERVLDEYKSGECKADKLIVIRAWGDASLGNCEFIQNGTSASEAITLLELVKAAMVDYERGDSE